MIEIASKKRCARCGNELIQPIGKLDRFTCSICKSEFWLCEQCRAQPFCPECESTAVFNGINERFHNSGCRTMNAQTN